MRVIAVMLAAFLAVSASAAAQVPDVPDPEGAEDTALATVCGLGLDLPVCPAAPARIPGDAAEAAHDHGGVAPVAPAETAQDAVEDIAQDPATAPDRIGDVVASIVTFVRDLLGVPAAAVGGLIDGLAAVGGGVVTGVTSAASAVATGASAAGSGAAAAAGAVGDAVGAAVDAIASLFEAAPAASDAAPKAPRVRDVGGVAGECVAGVCVDETVGEVTSTVKKVR